MKHQIVAILIMFAICGISQSKIALSESNEASSINKIVAAMLEALSGEKCLTFNVITATEKLHESKAKALRNDIAIINSRLGKASLRLDDGDKLEIQSNRLKRCSFILVDSFESFAEFHKQISWKLFKFEGYFVVILVNGAILEIAQMFELFWNIQIYNVDVVYEDTKGEAFVWTFYPFSAQNCGSTAPKLLAQTNISSESSVVDYFPPKVDDLFNCPIKTATADDLEPFIIITKQSNESVLLRGRDIELLNILSELLNFRIDYVFIGHYGVLFEV